MRIPSFLALKSTPYGRQFLGRFIVRQCASRLTVFHTFTTTWTDVLFVLSLAGPIAVVIQIATGENAPIALVAITIATCALWAFFLLRMDLWPILARLPADADVQARAHLYAHLRLHLQDAILAFQGRHPTTPLPSRISFTYGFPHGMHRMRLIKSVEIDGDKAGDHALLRAHLNRYPWLPRHLPTAERHTLWSDVVVIVSRQVTGISFPVPTISTHQLLKARTRTVVSPTP